MDDIPVPEIVELSPQPRRPSSGPCGRPPHLIGGIRPAAVVLIVGLVGAVAGGLRWGPTDAGVPRPSSASTASASTALVVSDILRHVWERPYAVTPGLDRWASGRLRIETGSVEFRSAADGAVSTSAVTASGPDAFLVIATDATRGCAPGDIGTYRLALEGRDTVLTLTASGPDACPVRETMLAGSWVRADLPPPDDGPAALSPGTHRTTSFDPFGDQAGRGRLSYVVPSGWEVIDESRSVSVLHRRPDAPGRPTSDVIVVLIAGARVASAYEVGATCGPTEDEPGVGRGLTDIVRAITTRRGVLATRSEPVTIGGRRGRLLDLRVAESSSEGCLGPEGRFVAIPLLNAPNAGASADIGLGADQSLRLIVLDLGSGGTLAVAAFSPGGAPVKDVAASVMPVIESFEFVSAAP